MSRCCYLSFSLLLCLISNITVAEEKPEASTKIDFALQIRPILSDHCFTCHGPDEGTRETDLRFDTEEGAKQNLGDYHAIVPGNSSKSELIRRLITDDDSEIMPPPETGRTVTKEQIELLKEWINQGAEWSQHWAFVPPKKAKLPKEHFPGWSKNDIDRFVGRVIAEHNFKPNPQANKETLIRRATLDLTGLPPTLEEIDAFLNDKAANAYDKVIDRLLASPHYGEHMAWAWLDAARYADSNGYQQDRTRTMWFWRDWVVNAMNDNLPFDQFTKEQIAGDLLPNPTLEQRIATGFNRNHMLNGEGGRIAEESRIEYVINRVDTTSTVWLGLTAGCARCHDHKYDPLSQKEFYQLFAFFNNVNETGRVDRGGNAAPVVKVPSPTDLAKRVELNKQLANLQASLKQLASPSKEEINNWVNTTKKTLAEEGTIYPWQLLKPEKYTSSAGADMKLEGDHTIFVSGKNPDKDDYEIHASLKPGNYTSLRLQALPHSSFTHQGLARSDSGNFVLTEFELTLNDKPIKLASAVADHEQRGHTVQRSIDGKLDTGWAVLKPANQMKETRTAIFKFAEPVTCDEKSTIVVHLKHQSIHKFHNIGRFQLALSENPEPSLENNSKLPDSVLSALHVDEKDRTATQEQALIDYLNEDKRKPLLTKITNKQSEIKKFEESIPQSMVMEELDKPRDSHVLIRGQWDKKGDVVTSSTPVNLHPFPKDSPNNRLGLANWLIDEKNPLTARVTVNRIWQQFFGTGLVQTTEDFGSQGERPSHPELLDYLAVDFVESGWDVKRLVKMIMLSATYQQSSLVTPEKLEADAGNRFLTRGSRYRLGSHTIRDQALHLSGLLNAQIGGKPVFPYQPEGIWQDFSLGKIKYAQDHGDKLYRRSLYTFWRRSVGPTMLFDVSARQVCVVRPSLTNTPLHSLTLLNETGYVESARVFAQRLLKLEANPQKAMRTGFRMATSRFPSEQELEALDSIYQKALNKFKADPEAVKQILAVGEYKSDESLDSTELAAMYTVTSVILNLDEVITKE